MVLRESYLKNIRPFYDNCELVKVITGMRRCGKSVLLQQIRDELQDGIFINFEFQRYDELLDAKELEKYILSRSNGSGISYVFLDEIQNVENWERAVNSLRASGKFSIFIAGSNSNLLSGELATHLAGRYVSFHIQPFSFAEVCRRKQVTKRQDMDAVFVDYLTWGGLPQRFDFTEERQTVNYMEDLYNSILLKDIMSRNKVSNTNLLELLVRYLVSTPSQTFSGTSVAKYFESINRKVGLETIYNYYSYIISSYIVSKVEKYDVRGKALLTKNDKYYLGDIGLGHVKNLQKRMEWGARLENVVYNELVRRGYTVYSGKNRDSEIDFIATRVNEKAYFQVCYLLADDAVLQREFGAYSGIDDNYPKYVLSMDQLDCSQNGIIHKNMMDFLLEE